MPSHFGGADECKVVDPSVGGQRFGERIVHYNGAGPLFRKTALVEGFKQVKAGKGGIKRGFYDYRAADSHRWYHLVNGEVKRVVEGRDGHHDPYRFPDSECHPVKGSGV